MGTLDAEPAERIDFAVVAYHDEGQWTVSSLPPRAATQLDNFVHALVQLPSDIGTIGMVSVDDEFFVLVRVSDGHTRLLLSDVGAATESPLARAVVERLELPPPDDDDDQMQPAGDLRLLTDLGLSAMDLGAICDETELYPDELLSDIAGRLGFGSAFEDIVDGALA